MEQSDVCDSKSARLRSFLAMEFYRKAMRFIAQMSENAKRLRMFDGDRIFLSRQEQSLFRRLHFG